MKQKKRITKRKMGVILFILLLLAIAYVSIRGSFLEYKELGENFVKVFYTNLKYRYIIIGINFVILFIILYFANRGIAKGLRVFFEEEKKQMPKLPNKSIAFIISAVVSIIISGKIVPKVILYASKVSFGEFDPVFNLDISFYMFVEPLLKILLTYIIGIFVGLILYSTIYYILVFNKFFDGIDRETLKNSYFIKKIIKYTRCISIVFAIYTLISSFDIVFDKFITTESGIELIGAGITNVTIRLWGNILFAIIIVCVIFKATINFKKGDNSRILKNVLIIPSYLVILFVTMIGFDLIFVNSNEYDKERKYIESNNYNTRIAYGIDCEDEIIRYSGTINSQEIGKNQNVINNIAIINPDIVVQNLKETQTQKGYYTYNSADILKYNINGSEQLLYVSPREIVNNRTYNSKTYEYTHGYGIIVTSATGVTQEGNVKYLQNDVIGKDKIINISKPQIYYGLETNGIVVTKSSNQKEYDYTDDKGNEYTTSYNGKSGLSINWWDRFVLGTKKGDVKLAFSNNVTKESKILINRNIIERAKVVLSDVIYDENPYMVVDDKGELYWILDAYTRSNSYPYSTYTTIEYNGKREKINYIRNSIKVIINSYDGTMKFYITDRTDPIAMAYNKIYPELFEKLDDKIPESISQKFVYPEFLYNVQATMMEEYHKIKSDVLYRSDDTWAKATYNTVQNNKSTGSILNAYYTMIKKDDSETIGLIQMYTPNKKQNLISYLVGTVENGENKLKLYKMSADATILGPTQLDNQITQDETIQSEIDALCVTGAKVTKNMIIVPIENTLLYVEPIYQTRINESEIPVLKKVVVASGNKVAIGNNLGEALQNLVSQYATSIETYTTEDINGIIQSIIKSNNNLNDSIKSNDWELIGSDIKKLQELISLLEKQVKEEKIDSKDNKQENIIQGNIIE